MTDVFAPSEREGVYRRNFRYFLTEAIFFSVAIGIINSTTVIPDFVRRLTDSEILIGLSGNMFIIGFSLPQLFVARYIVRYERKKWWFLGPNIPVRFVLLTFGMFALAVGKDHLEWVLPAFFICYGIAAFGDGVVGVPWADLTATSLDNRWRARMFGFTNAITGLIMLAIAPLIGIILSNRGPGFPANYAILFSAAGVLFTLSNIPITFIHELPGGKAAEKVLPFRAFLPSLGRVLRDDAPYRGFITARFFTSLFLMAAPFYIGYATEELELSSEEAVPILLAMQTAGSITGALAYTWLGARNNLLYIRLALGGATLLPVSALLAGVMGPLPLYIGFLISGMATSNLLFGYLNWIVGYAEPDLRPTYVGLAHSVNAVSALTAPFIAGTIAQHLGYRPLFAVSLLMALMALYVTVRYLRDKQMALPIAEDWR